jgi:hypothetical protein
MMVVPSWRGTIAAYWRSYRVITLSFGSYSFVAQIFQLACVVDFDMSHGFSTDVRENFDFSCILRQNLLFPYFSIFV